MIITIKEIEIRQETKTYFYDENNILIAIEEDTEITTIRELTTEEWGIIQEII